MNNRIKANLTYFQIEMKDKQVSDLVMENGRIDATVRNAAKAYSRGIELEFWAELEGGLEVMAGMGRVEAKFDDWIATEYNSDYSALVKNDYRGKHIPNIPAYNGNLGVQYRHLSGVLARIDVLETGAFYGNAANTVKEEAYTLVNLRLGYETEAYDLFLWGKNVFDTEYETVKYAWGEDEVVQDGDPAQFGITANYRF